MTARRLGGHHRLRKGRRTAVATLLSVAALLATTPAQAAFPERPIRLIIGFPAGGPLDAHARLLADRLQQLFKASDHNNDGGLDEVSGPGRPAWRGRAAGERGAQRLPNAPA